jgi:hypothetical protein
MGASTATPADGSRESGTTAAPSARRAFNGRTFGQACLHDGSIAHLESRVAEAKLKLRDDYEEGNQHPEHRWKRVAHVTQAVLQDVELRMSDGSSIVSKKPDLVDAGVHKPLDGGQLLLVRRSFEYDQHSDAGDESEDGKGENRRQVSKRSEEQVKAVA